MDISSDSKNPKKRPNEGQNVGKHNQKRQKNKKNKQVKEMEVEIAVQEQKTPLSNSKV